MALGSAVGGITGSLIGGLGGLAGQSAANKQASRDRARFRKGIRQGEARTEREVYDVLNSPEYQAARQFALGTFGIDVGAAGGPGGGVSFGGQTYESAPTGEALQGTRQKAANTLARQLARGYAAQQRQESGLSLTGQPIGQFQNQLDALVRGDAGRVGRRDERTIAGIAPYLQRATQLSAAERQIVNRQFARRAGVSLDEGLRYLSPAIAEADAGEPVAAAAHAAPGGVPGFGLNSPLARDFVTGIGQAQTSRGLYSSQAAASAEASGLAALNFQKQQELLPFLLGLSTFGSDYARGARQANISEAVQRVSGGAAVYGSANPFANMPVIAAAAQGVIAGAGAGAAIGANAQAAQAQQPVYGGPPPASQFGYNPYAQNFNQGGLSVSGVGGFSSF